MEKSYKNGVSVKPLGTEEDFNIAYIKKLAKYLRMTKPEDLFMAMMLYEKCETMRDIDLIKRKDLESFNSSYKEYLKDKKGTLMNPRWLK